MEQHSFANTVLPIISTFYTTLTICVVESVVGVWGGWKPKMGSAKAFSS